MNVWQIDKSKGMGNNDNKKYSKKTIGIIAIIIVIISLFVIFFYPSNTPDPSAPGDSEPVITVTKEAQ